MDIQVAEVTDIIADKIKVKFNQDDSPSELEYPKLNSYAPNVGDKVLMLQTNTSYICLGSTGETKDTFLIGEYKFFAKDKGLLWKGWAKCDGRALDRATYAELFAEIGIIFGGGDGSSTFNLPDTAGRVLSDSQGKDYGAKVGADDVALTISQMPSHGHNLTVSTEEHPGGYYTRYAKVAGPSSYTPTDKAIDSTGGGTAHENRQPTLYGGYYYIYTGVM